MHLQGSDFCVPYDSLCEVYHVVCLCLACQIPWPFLAGNLPYFLRFSLIVYGNPHCPLQIGTDNVGFPAQFPAKIWEGGKVKGSQLKGVQARGLLGQ